MEEITCERCAVFKPRAVVTFTKFEDIIAHLTECHGNRLPEFITRLLSDDSWTHPRWPDAYYWALRDHNKLVDNDSNIT